MEISEYQKLLIRYNAAWAIVFAMRSHVQRAQAYLSAYGLAHRGGELQFRISPNADIDAMGWPTAGEISQAISVLKDIGEEVVSAYNRLSKEDRYLVKHPTLK